MIDFLSISITNVILIVLLITVLVFFCLYIYADNVMLKKQIEELRKENKSLLEKKIMKQESTDSVSLKNISTEKMNINYEEKLNINPKPKIKQTNEESIQNNYEKEQTNNYAYSRPNDNFSKEKLNNKQNFNLNELINKNDSVKIKDTLPVKEIREYDYLEEIQARMNEELKPQTIELTDYEKKQEEQAVISYKELLRFKDNNHSIDEKQETINFIEELKNLRNSLK